MTTGFQKSESRPQRWDVPFDPNMTSEHVDLLLAHTMFSHLDPGRFPKQLPLREILRNDCRILSFQPDEVVMRQGQYGTSAFLVLRGTFRALVERAANSAVRRGRRRRRPFFDLLSMLWQNNQVPESRKGGQRSHHGSTARMTVADIPGVLDARHGRNLPVGELFGELSALGRIPRTVTVHAKEPATALEIRWQGLRDIRKYSPEFQELVDRRYRVDALREQLASSPWLHHLTAEQLQYVVDHTHLDSFGQFDWHAKYRELASLEPAERVRMEEAIVHQGDHPNGLLMIRSGFVRITVNHGAGERTVDYLGRGQTFGLPELAWNWRHPDRRIGMQCTMRAIGYADILIIPTWIVDAAILPVIPADDLPALPDMASRGLPSPETAETRQSELSECSSSSWAGTDLPGSLTERSSRREDLTEFLVEERFINGESLMVIDMDRCTRCDDCVRACAAAHDNNPRFLRQGPVFDGFMFAHACMHCADPVCLIGCPTGAIHRDISGGEVIVDPQTCIGCSVCAESCPYDNILMVPVRDKEGTTHIDPDTHTPLLQATKCDLCFDQWTGPACVHACPHDALFRPDLRTTHDLEAFER